MYSFDTFDSLIQDQQIKDILQRSWVWVLWSDEIKNEIKLGNIKLRKKSHAEIQIH